MRSLNENFGKNWPQEWWREVWPSGVEKVVGWRRRVGAFVLFEHHRWWKWLSLRVCNTNRWWHPPKLSPPVRNTNWRWYGLPLLVPKTSTTTYYFGTDGESLLLLARFKLAVMGHLQWAVMYVVVNDQFNLWTFSHSSISSSILHATPY